MENALKLANKIAKNAPIAVKYSKACIDRGMQMDIDDAIALENELFGMCYATADQKGRHDCVPGEASGQV